MTGIITILINSVTIQDKLFLSTQHLKELLGKYEMLAKQRTYTIEVIVKINCK